MGITLLPPGTKNIPLPPDKMPPLKPPSTRFRMLQLWEEYGGLRLLNIMGMIRSNSVQTT